MRIIGGEAGGRTIASPPGKHVRPTPDMMREALFNILPPLPGTTFLDLYAGTGSVGLEALSRGADWAVFVEKNMRMASQIIKTLKILKYDSRADVFAQEVKSGISRLKKAGEKFDIIFADPPYEKDQAQKTVQYCLDGGLLADGGMLVIQHSVREPINLTAANHVLTLRKEKRYGDSAVSFFHHLTKELEQL
jgi:16S rRNA (guanine966-N2)-methyltransferase